MLVLGIETSCDETAAALYEGGSGLLAHQIYSQTSLHSDFGGVVPELAARDHARKISPIIQAVCAEAGASLRRDVNAVAFTAGPGLMGALLVGATFGRTLAWTLDIPAIAIHHLEGHLMVVQMVAGEDLSLPFLALLVSGGHTLIMKVSGLGQYEVLGESLDDAVGEAFDKTAKLLGLGYPGGAALAALAEKGRPGRFEFPSPMATKPGLDLSFSGLKTHALLQVQALESESALDDQARADIALAFQRAAVKALVLKCKRALRKTRLGHLVVAGGVGANRLLRQELTTLARAEDCRLYYPPVDLCTDNGAMIAYAGWLRLIAGERSGLAVKVRARWPISELQPPTPHG